MEESAASSSSSSPPTTNSTPTAGTEDAVVSSNTTASKTSASSQQVSKLRDANTKYKSLLKMAKERIQAQEEELERIREELASSQVNAAAAAAAAVSAASAGVASTEQNGTKDGELDNTNNEESSSAVRVHIRLCVPSERSSTADGWNHKSKKKAKTNDDNGAFSIGGDDDDDDGDMQDEEGSQDIWALIEYETIPPESDFVPTSSSVGQPRRFRKWKKFISDAALSDHVRRESGEPIVLPPPSLSPSQSSKVRHDAKRMVARITEEFRKFRVRSEVARKQTDATVRALQGASVQNAVRRIEGQDLQTELDRARHDHAAVSSLRAELEERESQWKEAYDTLQKENATLRGSGAEALLAAQWRQRYETCLREKDDAEARFDMERKKVESLVDERNKIDAGKYEAKYRDLKESFRLYRKKAKEIFEEQQQHGGIDNTNGQGGLIGLNNALVGETTNNSGAAGGRTEEAKISYLRNLMVNYLSSDPAVREHMEGAIATVLKFSPEETAKISKKKESDAWF